MFKKRHRIVYSKHATYTTQWAYKLLPFFWFDCFLFSESSIEEAETKIKSYKKRGKVVKYID